MMDQRPLLAGCKAHSGQSVTVICLELITRDQYGSLIRSCDLGCWDGTYEGLNVPAAASLCVA